MLWEIVRMALMSSTYSSMDMKNAFMTQQTSEKLVQSFSKWCFRKKRCYTLIVEMKTNGVPELTENQFQIRKVRIGKRKNLVLILVC